MGYCVQTLQIQLPKSYAYYLYNSTSFVSLSFYLNERSSCSVFKMVVNYTGLFFSLQTFKSCSIILLYIKENQRRIVMRKKLLTLCLIFTLGFGLILASGSVFAEEPTAESENEPTTEESVD